MNPEDVKALVFLRMQQAEEALRDAHVLLREARGTRTAVNRAYYTAFYTVLALLQTVGEIPRKHRGAIASFDRLFVKTNRLPRECSKWLHDLYRVRVQDDYERVEPVPMEHAVSALEMSEQFLKKVEGYLTREGFLSE